MLARVEQHEHTIEKLDFANEAEKIQQSFEPYYEKTFLTEGTDPNLLYDLQTRLEDFHFYAETEVYDFGNAFYESKQREDVLQLVDLDSYRVQQTSSGKIALQRQRGEIEPMRTKQTHLAAAEDMEPLSQIVRALNEHFGLNLTEDDKISIRDLEGRLDDSETLKASVRANASAENVRLTFQHEASQLLQGMIDSNLKFYKQANDDPEFQKTFFDMLFDRYMKKAKSA